MVYFEQRVDNEYRWDFIKEYIGGIESCLDLGCAEGYFASKVAHKGVRTLGIEMEEDRLSAGREKWGTASGLDFACRKITPENVDQLASVDAVLFMTMYHNMAQQFGDNGAKNILISLAKNADIIVCEMPGDRFRGVSFRYLCTNKQTGEKFEMTNFEKPDADTTVGFVRPRLAKHLSPGKYTIKVCSKKYKNSGYLDLTVQESGRLEEEVRIGINNGEIEAELINSEFTRDLSDVTTYYKNLLFDIFGDELKIIDSTLTDYKGNIRNDILFIIDSFNIK